MEPTFDDQITGSIRQLQQNASQVLTVASRIAASTGLDKNVAHDALERAYTDAQRFQTASQQQWSQQTQSQYQPSLTGGQR